ncbi:nucleotidyltransferase family protein [Chitinophaga sp. MM2321]|uniref:nucleotidyltransferase family protein n=1 Tax=Chitinophaga sp. MM2321 TaxID=3137178 RepID=UPI0032D57940
MKNNTGAIILAAGASQRMGTPKQQLVFENKTLLQRVVHTALETGCSPVIVVLGAFATDIRSDLPTTGVTIVINDHWETGMAGSIHTGIQAMLRISHTVNNTFLLLCDQPFISSTLLHEMMTTQTATGKKIIACAYNNTIGTPVLFDSSFFPQLLQLTGQEGAKKILLQHPADVVTIPFAQGALDIDTQDDYKKLMQ